MGVVLFGSSDLTAPAELSSSGALVNERFEQARDYGDDAWTQAWGLLSALQDADYVVDWDALEFTNLPLMGLDGLGMNEPTVPTITAPTVALPTFNKELPVLDDVTIIADTPPEFSVADPAFNVPAVPDVEFPIFSDNAPQITDPDIPTKPTVNLPVAPTLDEISIPSPPEFNIPDFTGVEPTMDLTPPEPAFTFAENEHVSDLLTAVNAKLLHDVQTGGSGLGAATEQAIYDRATARQNLENQQSYDEALDFFASRGWVEPPGALAGKLLEVSHKISQVRTDLNNDILVQESNLAQANTHFILAQSIGHEKNLMDYSNQINQRAFDAAKYVVEAAILIYGIKVDGYTAQLTAYKALADVYVARIQAEAVKADLYKAQIEGVKASVDLQQAMIQAYEAQIRGVHALIDLYIAEMQGAKIQADIDQTKIASFTALVGAYQARIQAVTARYNAYEAQIRGEEAKARMYGAQVDAYKSRVEAFKARADVDISRAQVTVELNKAEVDIYRAAIDKFRAEVQASVDQASIEIKAEELDVTMYEAQIKAYSAEVDATVKTYLGRVEEAKAHLELQLKEADIAIKVALAKYGLTTQTVQSAAQIAAQLASAALSSVSASASIGHREARSDSRGYSRSSSKSSANSNSYSVSHFHSYKHTAE